MTGACCYCCHCSPRVLEACLLPAWFEMFPQLSLCFPRLQSDTIVHHFSLAQADEGTAHRTTSRQNKPELIQFPTMPPPSCWKLLDFKVGSPSDATASSMTTAVYLFDCILSVVHRVGHHVVSLQLFQSSESWTFGTSPGIVWEEFGGTWSATRNGCEKSENNSKEGSMIQYIVLVPGIYHETSRDIIKHHET